MADNNFGGGIYVLSCEDFSLENSTFTENVGYSGGAIYIISSMVNNSIKNVVF